MPPFPVKNVPVLGAYNFSGDFCRFGVVRKIFRRLWSFLGCEENFSGDFGHFGVVRKIFRATLVILGL